MNAIRVPEMLFFPSQQNTADFSSCPWIYFMAETSQQPTSQTTWLKVTPQKRLGC
jgi:hypothetical protein